MKTILLLSPIDQDNFTTNENAINEAFKNNPRVVYFSPSFLASEKVKHKQNQNKQFVLELLASTMAIHEQDFHIAEEMNVKEEQTMIYIGPAPKSLNFDEIHVLNYSIINTQEAYYDHHIAPQLVQDIDIHRSTDAEQEFDSIEDFIVYVEKEANNV